MAKRVSLELIGRQAAELHRIMHAAGRDAELAVEVSAINDAVHVTASDLEEGDEPGTFLRSLLTGMRKPEAGR